MTKPYSLDLRDRAVARVVAGETVRSVAATLRVGVSSVVKWSQRFRATGSAAPRKMGGYRPRVLIGEHRAWLLRRIASGSDTLVAHTPHLHFRAVAQDGEAAADKGSRYCYGSPF